MARNTIDTAFLELVEHAAAEIGSLAPDTKRYRVFAGKSARLLRRGDLVALSDMHTDFEPSSGIGRVVDAHVAADTDEVFVMLAAHGDYLIPTLIPASRLVLVHRSAR